MMCYTFYNKSNGRNRFLLCRNQKVLDKLAKHWEAEKYLMYVCVTPG